VAKDSIGSSRSAVLVSITSLSGAGQGAFVGGGVDEIRFYRSPSSNVLRAYARLREPDADEPDVLVDDLEVYDESGELVSETIGARLWYLDKTASADPLGDRRRPISGWTGVRRRVAGSRRAQRPRGGGSSLPTLAAWAMNCVIFAGRPPDGRACWYVPAPSCRSTEPTLSSGLASLRIT
jgi:hypothetical protein